LHFSVFINFEEVYQITCLYCIEHTYTQSRQKILLYHAMTNHTMTIR